MKRKATTTTKRVAKRSRGDNSVATVVGALANADALPDNLRSLLKASLPVVLNANKVDRHPYEAEVVDQAQQALTAVQGALQQAHAEALTKQNAVITPAERKNRTAAKQAAEAHLEATKAKLEANKATKKAAEKSVEDAGAALKEAKKEEKAQEKDMQKNVSKKDALTSALADEFVMLSEGTSAAAPGKKAVKKLVGLGKEYGLGDTLLTAFPITCKKPVAARTDFETMMFASLKALIEGVIQGLEQKLAEAEPVKAAKVGAAAAAGGALEQAEAALKAADDELTATQTAHKDAGKDVASADKHLRKLWEDMRQACESQDGLANNVKNFQDNVWTAFNQLKEKEPAPEPVEPEPVEEAAPEAAPEAAAADAPAAPQ